jgi:hypothetical protein
MAWMDTVPVQYYRNHLMVKGEFMKTKDAIGDGLYSGSSSSSLRGWIPL